MNKRGFIAEKTGYYIFYIFIFTFTILYAASILKVETITYFEIENVEDSMIATRVLDCFSNDKLGVIDDTKMTMVELRRCFDGDKYFLKINLDKKNGEDKNLEPYGKLHNSRFIERYVKLEGDEGILEIEYVKNLRRYEENAA